MRSPAVDGRPRILLTGSLSVARSPYARTYGTPGPRSAARTEVSAAGSEHPSPGFVAAEAGKEKQLQSDAGHGRMLYITHSHRENQNSCLPAAQFVSSIKHG